MIKKTRKQIRQLADKKTRILNVKCYALGVTRRGFTLIEIVVAIGIFSIASVIISGQENIWGSEPLTNKQPRVTLFLKLKNKAANPKFQKDIAIQTTISSKVY